MKRLRPPPSGYTQTAFKGSSATRRRYYFDSRLNSLVVLVSEGDFYVSSSPYEVLSTILGSCIAVCIRDPEAGCGGMNHFLLPNQTSANDGLPSAELRFGSYSIERLVNALISRGGSRQRMEVKVFGGANISSSQSSYGHDNADFVERYLDREKLKVVASSLRGTQARRIRYHPATGRASLSIITNDKTQCLVVDEETLASKTWPVAPRHSVDIFK